MQILSYDNLPKNVRDAIAGGLPRCLCPACRGGKSGEVSLSIRPTSEEGLIKLSCWRASCGFYAVSFVGAAARLQLSKVREGRPYLREAGPLSPAMLDRLIADYGLREKYVALAGWREEHGTGALVMPVHSPTGKIRGHVTRTFDDPKQVLAYKETAQPWLDWHIGSEVPEPPVLVEDQLSALRLRQLGYNAVALLGTNISADDAREVADVADGHHAILALDRDAFDKSLTLCRRHRHIIELRPVCLDDDIKNMGSDADIVALLDTVY